MFVRLPIALLLLTASPLPAEPYQPLQLTSAQATADIALMRRGLETIHPGLYRYRSHAEIDAAFARLESVAQRPVTDLALWRAIALMIAEIHCDHSKPEASDAIDRYRQANATHLPLRFQLIEGRMIVVSNDGEAGAPPPGAEITSINGIAVPVALTAIGKAVAYDGSTDQAIAAKLGEDGDIMGDDLDEYWPAFYGFPAQWELLWKRPGDAKLTRSLMAPIDFKTWRTLAWPGARFRAEFYNAINWRVAGTKAVLRIDTFVNYRNPVDATAFLSSFLNTLKGSRVTDLVLDLRENGGGSDDVSLALGRHLFPRPFTWSKPVLLKAVRYGDLPAHIESWGDPKTIFEPALSGYRRTRDGWWERIPDPADDGAASTVSQQPLAGGFAGRVTILTGPRNGSGATRTIAQFKEVLGARLVGEDSAGSAEGPTAGNIFLLTLPNSGLKVRIPNAWNRTNIAHFVPGKGVAVDERVTPTLADHQAGVDRALDVAKGVAVVPTPELGTVLAGNWSGTLDYRDYGNDGRVILPTEMTGSADGRLALRYDDGPGKTVASTTRWSVATDGRTVIIGEGKDRQVLGIVERRGGPGPVDLTLVAEGTGVENGSRVAVRVVLTRRGDTLSIGRQSHGPGQPWLMRDGYRLLRRNAG